MPAGHDHAFLAEEYSCGQHQNGGVDEEGDGERGRGVDGVETDGSPDRRYILLQLAALYQGGVQVKIMRHHGGADDADGDVQHSRLTEVRRNQRPPHLQKAGMSLGENKNLDKVAHRDGRDEHKNYGLNGAHSKALQGQQQQDVEPSDDHRPEQWDMEQQVEGHRASQDFGEIAGADGDLAHE